jgi:hypothetical protein
MNNRGVVIPIPFYGNVVVQKKQTYYSPMEESTASPTSDLNQPTAEPEYPSSSKLSSAKAAFFGAIASVPRPDFLKKPKPTESESNLDTGENRNTPGQRT